MPRPISTLDSHLGYWLRMASNAVSYSFASRVESAGVTVAEWVFLRVLYEFERLSPTDLAAHMGMTKGAITKLAHRLVDKQLVVRTANPADGRAQTLALAPEGRALVPRLARLADANDAAFFGVLDERERRSLRRILGRIVELNSLRGMPTD